MLTVAPTVATMTLSCLHLHGIGDLNPLKIVGFALFALPFALITPQLWPTYIPAIIFTPILMKWISRRPGFSTTPLIKFLLCSFLVGALAGVGVMSVMIAMEIKVLPNEATDWVWMGISSGGITLTLIALIYRKPALLK
jgi:hypothetical protein